MFNDIDNIEVDYYDELTVDYCKRVDAKYILRGLGDGVLAVPPRTNPYGFNKRQHDTTDSSA